MPSRYAFNTETGTVHDTKTQDERCNLDDARAAKSIRRVTAAKMLHLYFLSYEEFVKNAKTKDRPRVLKPCLRCMS